MGLKELLELDQYPPEDWGASVDYDSWSRKTGTSQVFVHWTGTPVKDAANEGNKNSEKATLRGIEDYHLGKDWKGAAYDWAIGQSGTLYRVRGLGRSAATSGDVDRDGFSNNVEGEAILLLYGDGQEPSEALLGTLGGVLEALDYDQLYGHQEASTTGTACPGKDAMEFLKEWRDGNKTVEPSAPEPTPKTVTDKKKPETKKTWTENIMAELGVHKKGDRDIKIKRLQALINTSGLNSLKEDGIFGPKTEQAVYEYQDHFNLTTDGIVGPQTWKHLLLSNY